MRRILVIIVLFMLCGVAPVAAQRVVEFREQSWHHTIDDYVQCISIQLKLNVSQQEQITEYIKGLSDIERYMLLVRSSDYVDSLQGQRLGVIYKYNKQPVPQFIDSLSARIDILDKSNGYISLCENFATTITYWNMQNGNRLIGCTSNIYETEFVCFNYRFYVDNGQEIKPIDLKFDASLNDFIKLEELERAIETYYHHQTSQITAESPCGDIDIYCPGIRVELPRKGTTVRCSLIDDSEIKKQFLRSVKYIDYQYNGDGTFTRIRS